jgi:hypothetical protein
LKRLLLLGAVLAVLLVATMVVLVVALVDLFTQPD